MALMRLGKVQMMSIEGEERKSAPIAIAPTTSKKEDIVIIEIETIKKMVVKEKRAAMKGRKVADIVEMKTREREATMKRRERGVVMVMVIRSALRATVELGKTETD